MGNHLLALQRPLEEAQEGGQAEAVHVVDLRQVADDKIHPAGALGQRQVGIPLLEGRKRQTRQGDKKKVAAVRSSRRRNSATVTEVKNKINP